MGSGMDVQPDAERAPQDSEVEAVARVLRGGGDLSWRSVAADCIAALDEVRRSSPQGEDHEAGIEAAKRAAGVLRCHGGFDFDEALIEPVIAAYLYRVTAPPPEREDRGPYDFPGPPDLPPSPDPDDLVPHIVEWLHEEGFTSAAEHLADLGGPAVRSPDGEDIEGDGETRTPRSG